MKSQLLKPTRTSTANLSFPKEATPQHSISKEATEEFDGMELLVPGFEDEQKRPIRPITEALIPSSARAVFRYFRLHDHFLDYKLLSTPLLYFLYW